MNEHKSPENTPNYVENLNPAQKEAVLHTEGPLLIVAGAGAGKTKTLTTRILHLIKKGIEPHNILAITFTNKAAKEMRERVFHLLGQDENLNRPLSMDFRASSPLVCTFHSLGVRIIKENAQYFGLTKNFSIFDRNDSKSAIKEALIESGYDPKQYEPGKVLGLISKMKGDMITLERLREEAGNDYMKNVALKVWEKYELTLKKEKSLDFDDLLLKTAVILKRESEILARYQELWKYIHIDEYQDTNEVQYEISKLLSSKYRNLCVVGDADQTIYTWRGADIKNILNFEKDYPEARVLLLEENYRSTQTILSAANSIIQKNIRRKEKNLFTKNAEGEKIGLFEAYNEADEADFIAEKVERLISEGGKAKEMCVLYRANFQSRILEEAFLRRKIPYQLLGTRFFDRKEVKDLVSYIRLALNPDSLTDLKRIINTPTRGIGKVTVIKLLAGQEHTLPSATREKISGFKKRLKEIEESLRKDKPSIAIKNAVRISGMDVYLNDGTEEGTERLENLKELVSLATKYDFLPQEEGIEKFMEEISLMSDQDSMEDKTESVKLMTVHASKGLEFDYVFISGLETDLFPHKKMGEGRTDDEEERRLFYVALTRARKKIFLSYARARTIFGSLQVNAPSEFIQDIPLDHFEEEKRSVSWNIKEIFIDY